MFTVAVLAKAVLTDNPSTMKTKTITRPNLMCSPLYSATTDLSPHHSILPTVSTNAFTVALTLPILPLKVILRGLKAPASIFLWPTVRGLFDVPFHGGIALCPDRLGTVAVGPEALAPEELFQCGTFLPQ